MSFSLAHMNSIFRDALSLISGQNGEPSTADFSQAMAQLGSISEEFPAAKAKLAVLTALGAGDNSYRTSEDDLFMEAASTGYPSAVRDLGALVLMSGINDGMGAGLLSRAASTGDWIAAFLILREACRGHYFLSAQNLKGLAGQMSDAVPFKPEILKTIQALPDDIVPIEKSGFSLDVCKSALTHRSAANNEESKRLNGSKPLVKSYSSVLSSFECDYLIAVSCSSMQPSKVVSAEAGEGISAGYRTSDGTVLLPHMLDYPTARIINKLSAIAGIEPKNGEFLSLLRYQPGQEYRPHHDFLQEDANDYSMIKKCGQRCATLLTYLNYGYAGGDTEFPELNIKYSGDAGASLYFENTDEKGKPIQDSLHAGQAVETGEKWLATLWIREKPFWPWTR